MIALVVSKLYPQWLVFWFTLEWVSELKNDFGAFTAKNIHCKKSHFHIAVIQVQSKSWINTVSKQTTSWIDDLFALWFFDFFSRGYPSTKLWEIWLVGQIDPYFFGSLARSILIFCLVGQIDPIFQTRKNAKI